MKRKLGEIPVATITQPAFVKPVVHKGAGTVIDTSAPVKYATSQRVPSVTILTPELIP